MSKFPEVGDPVIYCDSRGNDRPALLTAIWGGAKDAEVNKVLPCVNVVFVCSDEAMKDDYGRQIARMSSVVHAKGQTAHGNYWRLPGEEKSKPCTPST